MEDIKERLQKFDKTLCEEQLKTLMGDVDSRADTEWAGNPDLKEIWDRDDYRTMKRVIVEERISYMVEICMFQWAEKGGPPLSEREERLPERAQEELWKEEAEAFLNGIVVQIMREEQQIYSLKAAELSKKKGAGQR